MSTQSPPKEKLPRGVGRVPAWWMELTPHYVLDLEEDENRRQQEEQEALYYAQMAAADDARTAGEWKSSWGGRGSNGGSGGNDDGSSALFGGRNFQPGSAGWDPKEWGIKENDPDYKAYLTGAKLPQSYIDAMKAFAGQAGLVYDASALNSSGKYGRQAEKPAFMPIWAKKKLRSTGQGKAIRHGIYHDSPNKHLSKRTVNLHRCDEDEDQQQQQQASPPAPTTPTTPPAPVQHTPAPVPSPPKPAPAPAPAAPVQHFNKPAVEHSYVPAPIRSNTPAAAPAPEPPEEKQKKYNFKYVSIIRE